MKLKEKHKEIVRKYLRHRRVHFQEFLTEEEIIDRVFQKIDMERWRYEKNLEATIKRNQQTIF